MSAITPLSNADTSRYHALQLSYACNALASNAHLTGSVSEQSSWMVSPSYLGRLPMSILSIKPMVLFKIKDNIYEVLIDTGADVTYMCTSVATELSLPIVHSSGNERIQLGNQTMTSPVYGWVKNLEVTVLFMGTEQRTPSVKFSHDFPLLPIYVPESPRTHRFLLGADLWNLVLGKVDVTEFITRHPLAKPPTVVYANNSIVQSNTKALELENSTQSTLKTTSVVEPLNLQQVNTQVEKRQGGSTKDEQSSIPLDTVWLSCLSEAQRADILQWRQEHDKIAGPGQLTHDITPAMRDQIAGAAKVMYESGYGFISAEDQARRPEPFTDLVNEELYARGRAVVEEKIHHLLEENYALPNTFCNHPLAIVNLRVPPGTQIFQRQYRVAHSLVPVVREVVLRWLKDGKIKKAPANCPYNSPLTVAPKRDGDGNVIGYRICLDTRRLNSALQNYDGFQLPRIRDVLEKFGGMNIFGEFDLTEAYLQFQFDEQSQPLTAFTWEGQQYVFVGCCFGISLLPGYFQRVISDIFKDLDFVDPYIDNLPFGSRTWEEHADHAALILMKLNQFNLKIKPKSVKVGHASIRCLGHEVSGKGISIHKAKADAIRDWVMPTTGKHLQSFLGFVKFVRQHVRHIAELTAPLETAKNQKSILWDDNLRTHWYAIKEAIAKAPTLRYPQWDRPFHIACDASNTGIGSVLFQPSVPDEYITDSNIVTIHSRKLTDTETRYPAYRKELLAVKESLLEFHYYVWGRNDLVIITDHKPLTYLFSATHLSPAVSGWLDIILDYNFKIVHRPGLLHVVPDQLSRMYSSCYMLASCWGVSDPGYMAERVDDSEADLAIMQSFPAAELATPNMQERLRNPQLSVRASGMVPLYSVSNITAVPATVLKPSSPSLDVGGGMVDEESFNGTSKKKRKTMTPSYRANKLLVDLILRDAKAPPESERIALIRQVHARGHFGREAIRNRLVFDDKLWWPNMNKDIEEVLGTCDRCLQYTVTRSGFHPAKSVSASGPGDHCQVDLSTHWEESPEGFKVLLHYIDVFTGFLVLRPLKDGTAESVAQALWDIWCLLGPPKIVQSDNGPEFVNKVLRALTRLTGVDHRFITPYNPRADGKVERSVGTVTLAISKMLHGTKSAWSRLTPFVQAAFNDKYARLTGSTPYSLMFGRRMNAFVDYTHNMEKPIPVTLENWKTHQEKVISVIYPAISDRIKLLSADMRKRLDAHRKALDTDPYPKDSIVMIKDVSYATRPGLKPKTEPKYVGPYIVVRRTRHGAYLVKDTDGNFLDRMVSIDHIKKASANLEMETIYQVEDILDDRERSDGGREFLTKWQGYDEPTWNREEDFLDTRLIQDYWKKRTSASDSVQPIANSNSVVVSLKPKRKKGRPPKSNTHPSLSEDPLQQDEDDGPVEALPADTPSVASSDISSQVVTRHSRRHRS